LTDTKVREGRGVGVGTYERITDRDIEKGRGEGVEAYKCVLVRKVGKDSGDLVRPDRILTYAGRRGNGGEGVGAEKRLTDTKGGEVWVGPQERMTSIGR